MTELIQAIRSYTGRYTYNARATVKSRFLKGFYLSMAFCIVAYTIIDMVALHRYAVFEPVDPIQNVWQAQLNVTELTKDADRSFCNNPLYDFDTGYGWRAFNTGCEVATDVGRLVSIAIRELLFLTRFQRALDPACDSVACESTSFVVGADLIPFNIIHGFYSSFLGKTVNSPKAKIVDSAGRLVRTVPSGEQISTTVKEIIALTGFSLDDINHAYRTQYRNTGMVIMLGMEYSNLRSWDLFDEVECKVTASLMEGLWGYPGPSYFLSQRIQSFCAPQQRWCAHCV